MVDCYIGEGSLRYLGDCKNVMGVINMVFVFSCSKK